jgi:hypothetical protein
MFRNRRLLMLVPVILLLPLLLAACDDTKARLEADFVEVCTLSTLGMDEQECQETLDDIQANYPEEYDECISDLELADKLNGTELFVCLGQKNVGLD